MENSSHAYNPVSIPGSVPNFTYVAIDPAVVSKFINGVIDARYPDLSGHQQRIRKSTVLFAQQIGLSKEDTELLSVGAGMHDIGKLSISDYILNKPSQLTLSEIMLIKQHTEMGCKLLSPLNLDSRITEIVLYHHENYDGTGYPEGISGDEIPLLARAVRILDSFDALTMDRPYHKGVNAKEALQIIRRDSQYYDPNLLELFGEIKLLPE
ncbi:HD-GYP domain-containing protein [Nitrosomonas sp.]|uniref:HD-GYP domain-containing protein n=1 Tax=Nitrosomonas sp. TaxID=42353 RepID=UPI00374D29F0